MSLFTATLISGILLLFVGGLLAWYPSRVKTFLTGFPRNKTCTFVLLLVATSIVLYEVTQLREADFGNYKHILFGFFLALAIGAWFRVPDFLGVRALSVIGLLFAGVLLRSAFLEPPQTRLFLTAFSYAIIIGSLYLAAVPYRLRDLISALNHRPGLRRTLGCGLGGYGFLLCLIPLSY